METKLGYLIIIIIIHESSLVNYKITKFIEFYLVSDISQKFAQLIRQNIKVMHFPNKILVHFTCKYFNYKPKI